MAPSNAQYDVEVNGWSWNRFANVLYIEAPAGVGFSYSNTSSDYKTNNEQTSLDNYVFLQNWLQQFPEYSQSPLWVSGESYGGDYVPQLVLRILQGNNTALKNQFAGMMIGNPVLDCDGWKVNGTSVLVESFYNHGMIPLNVYQQWQQSGCVGQGLNPPLACLALQEKIQLMVGPFDPDDLYTDECTGNSSLEVSPNTPSCSQFQQRRNVYLNRADVQAAIHARLGTYWVSCTNSSSPLVYVTDWPNMLPAYVTINQLAPQARILIYSGDVDIATCPLVYTQLCIAEMNRAVVGDWRPWRIDGATAGYTQDFTGLTLATVKGAGHEVPMFAPRAAFQLISTFISGKPIAPLF